MPVLALVTAATGEPVSRTDMKKHLRVTIDDDDDLIDEQIASATRYYQDATNRQLINATWKLLLDKFPSGSEAEPYSDSDGNIRLPRTPLLNTTAVSITYITTTGGTTTLSTTGYTVDKDSEPGRVFLSFGASWPLTRRQNNAVTIQFPAGHGTSTTDVPAMHKSAIKLLVEDLYEHRGAQLETRVNENITLQRLLWLNRVPEIG